jgi:hypothetical protein
MLTDGERRAQEILKSLTQLDLYHHSLRVVGEKLVSQSGQPGFAFPDNLFERALQLAEECSRLVWGLRESVDTEDARLWESAVNRVDLAIRRVSGARTPTLKTVNIWRAVEACDEFLSSVGRKYGYARLNGDAEVGIAGGEETNGADLARLFAEYGDAMATRPRISGASSPPFQYGILRWRGSQLFYVERVEDGARWIELEPDSEPRTLSEEVDGAELSQARTIEGYEIELVLDAEVDADRVDDYVRAQRGQEYYVSGHHVTAERRAQGGPRGGRR